MGKNYLVEMTATATVVVMDAEDIDDAIDLAGTCTNGSWVFDSARGSEISDEHLTLMRATADEIVEAY